MLENNLTSEAYNIRKGPIIYKEYTIINFMRIIGRGERD